MICFISTSASTEMLIRPGSEVRALVLEVEEDAEKMRRKSRSRARATINIVKLLALGYFKCSPKAFDHCRRGLGDEHGPRKPGPPSRVVVVFASLRYSTSHFAMVVNE